MGRTVAVDESTAGRYILAATFVDNSHVVASRQQVTTLRGQVASWRHTAKVDESVKLKIVSMITALEQHAVAYDAGGDSSKAGRENQRERRNRCLAALVADIAALDDDVRLVLDSHDQEKADREALYRALRVNRCEERVTYCHLPEQSEPLIMIADAVAWFNAKGGLWPGRLGVASERKNV